MTKMWCKNINNNLKAEASFGRFVDAFVFGQPEYSHEDSQPTSDINMSRVRIRKKFMF